MRRADRVGERIYNVRKQELRGFDSIFQSSKVMAAVVREARRCATDWQPTSELRRHTE